MKKVILSALFVSSLVFIQACGGGNPPAADTSSTEASQTASAEDESKGIGPIKEVTMTHPLDQGMVKSGKEIYDLKCSSCHKLDKTKLVGPGWQDVTKRRKGEWIMNFVTNVDVMLNQNAEAMALLEECLVRMPNQNLSQADARNIYEFMRQNDGEK